MGRLISLAFMLILGVLVYNYFLGDEVEKQQAKEIFKEGKELGRAIKSLVKSERERYDEGKYDSIVSRVKSAVGKDKDLEVQYSSQLNEIEELQKKIEAEQEKKERNSPRYNEAEEKLLKKLLDTKLEQLSNDLES